MKCNVGVDLVPMLPGGANGGLKPATLAFLRAIQEQHAGSIRFTFLVKGSMCDELLQLVRPQDVMVCIADRRDGADTKIKNIQVVTSFRPTLLIRLGVDVLYCPFGSMERSHPRIPTVSMIVDLLHRDYPHSISAWERKRREDYFQDVVSCADKIQCISRYTYTRLTDEYSVQNAKMFLTYLPIPASDESVYGFTRKEPIFVYPANFWTHKNHETLLVAYQLYRHIATDPWDLVLTGYLDERAAQLRQLAKALLVDRHVHFMGHVDEPQLLDLFRRASGLIYPSLHEGFGIPLIEAMSFRIPIVCSDCGSIPEIAGFAALRVDVKNPIQLAAGLKRVTEDGNLRERLVFAGEKRLQDFDLSKEVQKLASALLRAKRDNGPMASLKRYTRYFRRGGCEVLSRLWTWIGTSVETHIGSARQRVRLRIYLVKLRLFHLKRRLMNAARSRALTR